MNPLRVVVGSFNPGKVREICELLAKVDVEVLPLSRFPGVRAPDETGETFEENAALKAVGLARQVREWVLADDSGLEVDALDGRPGVHSARYGGHGLTDAQKVARLLREIKDVPPAARTARFQCVVVMADAGGPRLKACGRVEGRIASAPAGQAGFGYDPVFIPEGYDRTFGELGPKVKQRISHRARALARWREHLTEWLEQGHSQERRGP